MIKIIFYKNKNYQRKMRLNNLKEVHISIENEDQLKVTLHLTKK